ncbi:MAG TPA: BPSS1780 family membrane protein [Burkholderiales bacterium]
MTTTNPYAAPKAAVADAVSPQAGNFVPGGHAVPAGRGWDWIASAWNLFKRQPGMWVGMIIVLGVIFIGLALIPVIGSLALSLLFPVFGAGFAIGCRALDQGGELEFGHLFAGFRERFGTLVAVGALYLAVSLAIFFVFSLISGLGMMVMLGGNVDPEAMAGTMQNLLLATLVMMALMIPLAMAVWFAAPLVVFHQRGALEAMKESFFGCLKNILPFLLYGVILFLLSMVATIPLGLGWLVLGPVAVATIYTGYRDIYFT